MDKPTANAATSIAVSATIRAPVDRIYEAWTTQEGWNAWFTTGAVVDCIVGGHYRNADRDEGTFTVVRPPSSESDGLVEFTWENAQHCPGSFVEVRFTPLQERSTRVELIHRGLRDEAGQADMREGWSWALTCCTSWFETGKTISFEAWRAEQAHR